MGAVFRLPCVYLGAGEDSDEETESAQPPPGALSAWIARTQAAGVRLWAARADARRSFDEFEAPPPAALCVGGEGGGLPPELAAAAEGVAVPMAGRAESLNVAVAAGVLLYAAGWWKDGQRTCPGA